MLFSFALFSVFSFFCHFSKEKICYICLITITLTLCLSRKSQEVINGVPPARFILPKHKLKNKPVPFTHRAIGKNNPARKRNRGNLRENWRNSPNLCYLCIVFFTRIAPTANTTPPRPYLGPGFTFFLVRLGGPFLSISIRKQPQLRV